jgi:hypothetical protein
MVWILTSQCGAGQGDIFLAKQLNSAVFRSGASTLLIRRNQYSSRKNEHNYGKDMNSGFYNRNRFIVHEFVMQVKVCKHYQS